MIRVAPRRNGVRSAMKMDKKRGEREHVGMSNGGFHPRTVSFAWPTTFGELKNKTPIRYKRSVMNDVNIL